MEAPSLYPGLQFYYTAYLTLTSCRTSAGMSEGRIPWTAVAQYADRYGLDDEEMDLLWTLVCEMDSVYLKYQQKKGKIKSAADKDAKKPQIIHPPRKTR